LEAFLPRVVRSASRTEGLRAPHRDHRRRSALLEALEVGLGAHAAPALGGEDLAAHAAERVARARQDQALGRVLAQASSSASLDQGVKRAPRPSTSVSSGARKSSRRSVASARSATGAASGVW
jgi:hypothetical protein